MKTIPWLMLVFALASSCRAAEGNEVATHGVAPEPWLENQASLARAGGWEEIERDALRRLMSMNPNDAGPKLEELRLAITNAVPDIGQIKELVRNLCASPDEKACREARVLQASIEPPMSDALASARLLFRAGRSAEALELYQKTFPATQGRPPESSLELEYLSVLLTIPGREAEGVKGIEALIRRTEEHGSVILSRRAASLLAHHHFERTLAEALNDIYENGTRRERAARVLEKALKTFPQDSRTHRWRNALNEGLYWIGVDRGDMLAARGRFEEARKAYRECAHFRPDLPYSHLGLAKIARRLGQWGRLKSHLADALAASRGAAPSERKRVAGLLARVDEDQRDAAADLYELKARNAEAGGNLQEQIEMLERTLRLRRPEPWTLGSYTAALLAAGRRDDALQAWQKYAPDLRSPEWALPYARFLVNAGMEASALDIAAAAVIPDRHDEWMPIGKDVSDAEKLLDLREELETNAAYEAALGLATKGEWAMAAEMLSGARPEADWQIAQLARWEAKAGLTKRAVANWDRLSELPEWEREAPLNAVEVLLGDMNDSRAHQAAARRRLHAYLGRFDKRELVNGRPLLLLSMAEVSRLGALLEEADDAARALRLYRDYAAHAPEGMDEESAIVVRKAAQSLKDAVPEEALQLYRKAFVNAGMLEAGEKEDDAAFTRAMRTPDQRSDSEWLQNSLRSGASELYLNETPEIRTALVWNYDSGTPGFSNLSALTWVKEARLPAAGGWLTLRADTVHYDVGNLRLEEPYGAKFGTCYAPGCRGLAMRRDFGESLAVAWARGAFAFDVGMTPIGFTYSDPVGGASYSWDLDPGSITLSFYRRPKSSSLLSFGGMRDPQTGRTWGGVRRTGFELSGSLDEGGSDGFWGFVSWEMLTGRNVAENRSLQAMAGWYHRWVNEPNHERTAGISLMYWHFDKDLSDYVWGQGGYYSPQQFASFGGSLSEARRSADWSWILEGRLGISYAKSSARDRYPIKDSMPLLSDLYAREAADSSVGIGLSARAAFERRLADRWFLGGEFIYQKSDGYTPVLATLWLRYTLNDWAGDLPLPPVAPEPYSEWQ